jgi:hypothetical protein
MDTRADEWKANQVDSIVDVAIPGPWNLWERASRYGKQLNEALERKGLGEVTGRGGSWLEGPTVNVDVKCRDLALTLPALREDLVAIGIPHGTRLHYCRQGLSFCDEYSPSGWLVEQPIVFD